MGWAIQSTKNLEYTKHRIEWCKERESFFTPWEKSFFKVAQQTFQEHGNITKKQNEKLDELFKRIARICTI